MSKRRPDASELLAAVTSDEFAAEHGKDVQDALAESLLKRRRRGIEDRIEKKLLTAEAELLMMPQTYQGEMSGDGNTYPETT